MRFELTIRFNPYDGLANRCLQPLGHPSSPVDILAVPLAWEVSSGPGRALSTPTDQKIKLSYLWLK